MRVHERHGAFVIDDARVARYAAAEMGPGRLPVLDRAGVARVRAMLALARARIAWDKAVRAEVRARTTKGTVILRCDRCGVRIAGLEREAAALAGRAAVHLGVCPGGERASDVWLPFVRRAHPGPFASSRTGAPALRLIRGGTDRVGPRALPGVSRRPVLLSS